MHDTELNECLDALRSGKAVGCDNVPVEAYRGSIEAKSELFRLCRLMWHSERIPQDLVRGVFVMLHKKGPRDDFANYRAICLLCHSYKLLSAVVAHTLMDVLESHLPDTQAGFKAMPHVTISSTISSTFHRRRCFLTLQR